MIKIMARCLTIDSFFSQLRCCISFRSPPHFCFSSGRYAIQRTNPFVSPPSLPPTCGDNARSPDVAGTSLPSHSHRLLIAFSLLAFRPRLWVLAFNLPATCIAMPGVGQSLPRFSSNQRHPPSGTALTRENEAR